MGVKEWYTENNNGKLDRKIRLETNTVNVDAKSSLRGFNKDKTVDSMVLTKARLCRCRGSTCTYIWWPEASKWL